MKECPLPPRISHDFSSMNYAELVQCSYHLSQPLPQINDHFVVRRATECRFAFIGSG